ncbi:hypothetical protein ABMA10_19345 [Plantibacter sp. RU18]
MIGIGTTEQRAARHAARAREAALRSAAVRLFGRGARVEFTRDEDKLATVTVTWRGQRLDDEQLLEIALHEFEKRLPGLSWIHTIDRVERRVRFVRRMARG